MGCPTIGSSAHSERIAASECSRRQAQAGQSQRLGTRLCRNYPPERGLFGFCTNSALVGEASLYGKASRDQGHYCCKPSTRPFVNHYKWADPCRGAAAKQNHPQERPLYGERTNYRLVGGFHRSGTEPNGRWAAWPMDTLTDGHLQRALRHREPHFRR